MEYNNLFVTHKVIQARLGRTYKQKQFQEYDVMEWCQECMNEIVKDIEMMSHYMEIPLEVPTSGTLKNKVYTPCNIFRLLDVYDFGDNKLDHSFNGSYIILPSTNTLEAIKINYVGMPIDDRGVPLIPKQYQNAAETYCKMKAFEEDVALGKFSAQIYSMWDQKLSGYIAHARNDLRGETYDSIDQMNIIHGNLLPTIANIQLAHKFFE